jgi:hypothetical protein
VAAGADDVLCCAFHPQLPWIASGGVDGRLCFHHPVF